MRFADQDFSRIHGEFDLAMLDHLSVFYKGDVPESDKFPSVSAQFIKWHANKEMLLKRMADGLAKRYSDRVL